MDAQCVSPKELDDLSLEVSDCWQSLGIQLGVELARIKCILNDNVQFPSLQRKAFAMLNSWHDKGSVATYQVLSQALVHINKSRLAEKYCGRSKKAEVCKEEFYDNAVLPSFCQHCVSHTSTTHMNHDLEHLKEAATEKQKHQQQGRGRRQQREEEEEEEEEEAKVQSTVCREERSRDKETLTNTEEKIEKARQAIQRNSQRLIELVKRHEEELLSELDVVEDGLHKMQLAGQLDSTTQHLSHVTRSASRRGICKDIDQAEQSALDRTQQRYDILVECQSPENLLVQYKPEEKVFRLLENLPLGRVFVGLTDCREFQPQERERSVMQKDGFEQFPVAADKGKSQSQKTAVYQPHPLDSHVTKRQSREYTAVSTFLPRGSDKDNVEFLFGIATNRIGELAVSDYGNHRVKLFSADGKYLKEIGTTGTADGQLNNPVGVAFNRAGHIIVADQFIQPSIQVFSPSGHWIKKFGQDVLKEPWGVSVTSDDNIVACDTEGKKVFVFSPTGSLIQQFDPSAGTGACPLHAIFCDNKYFVSIANQVVKVFNSRGSHLYDIGCGKDSVVGQLSGPTGLAVDTDDLLLVCDRKTHCVRAFALNGEFVTSFGSRGSGLGQFNSPEDITVSRNGHVFVADSVNNRIQVFQVQY